MNTAAYLPILILFIVLLILRRNRRVIIARRIIKNKRAEDKREMIELAKRFIGKECIITAFDSSHRFEGVIKEVTEGAILIEKDGKLEVVNLDFVIRIKEYPTNKNGKKKALVWD